MKLSEISGAKTFDEKCDMVAKLLPITRKIATNENIKADMKENGSTYTAFLTALIKHARNEAVEIIAALNEIDVEQYKAKATAATIIGDLYSLLYDDELMELFGLAAPSLDKTSSKSAETNTGAEKK